MGIFDVLKNAVHNRKLYRDGKANKDEVRSTTVGWRPGEGDFVPDPGNDGTKTGEDYDTPSGNREYYRVIRKKKGR